jgi:L-ascorbate metabolism protein UlaG (beta-lactamase superfamily)
LADRITYVGHATILIELGGVRLITDPLLRERFMHIRRHREVPDPSVARDIDAVLISHLHADHLDPPSLRMVGSATRLIVPERAGATLRRRGFAAITELAPGSSATVDALTVTATPAVHDARRYKLGRRLPALGYVVEGAGSRVYFAGDTDLFDEMAELGELDLALVPIWGWGPTLGRGKHLDPERAAEALRLLRPRIAVPIHWGTYHPLHHGVRNLPAFLRDPPGRFVAAAAAAAPDVEVRVLKPGETLVLKTPT